MISDETHATIECALFDDIVTVRLNPDDPCIVVLHAYDRPNVAAIVWLTPDEARQLAATLTRYATEADQT